MRILNVAQTYFPYLDEGGRPAKVRALSEKLCQRGHQVTVLTADLGPSDWKRLGIVPQKSAFGLRHYENGVVGLYLPTLFRYRVCTLNPRVARFCRSSLKQFDLVHFYGLYDLLGPIVAYFCRRQGIPYVIEPMGMYRPIDRSFRLKRVWHKSLGRAFWDEAARIVATSEMEQKEISNDCVPPQRVVIRYNGIESGLQASLPPRGMFRAKWGISQDEFLILFLGRLIPRKGADMLIESFAEACPQSGRLVIAGPEGEPGYRVHLERCIQKANMEARVLLTGPLYDEEKKAVFADTDLFVLPSRYENFANAAAEAIACGIPVIVTDSCGIRTLVNDQAGLVIPPEKEALAAALRKLLGDKALYLRLKEGCRRVADQLSWDRLTEQMEGYYTEVLAKRYGNH